MKNSYKNSIYSMLKADIFRNGLIGNLGISSSRCKSLSGFVYFLCVVLMTIIFTGCADELGMNVDRPDSQEGITLMIPDMETTYQNASSRAQSSVTEAEGKINDLWIFIFKENYPDYNLLSSISGDYTEAFIEANTVNSESSVDVRSYKGINLKLEEGKYKIYVLGNLNSYNPTFGNYKKSLIDVATLDDLESVYLKFEDEIQPGNLPMASMSAIKKEENAEAVSYTTLSISNSDHKIYADMSFLCSKVRFTALFDKEDSEFLSNKVDFDSEVKSEKVNTKTYISSTVNNPSTEFTDAFTYTLHNTNYPSSEEEKRYITGLSNDTYNLANLTLKDGNWDDSDSQRAWQGIFYIPENLQTSLDKKTSLFFLPAEGAEAMQNKYELKLFDTKIAPGNKGIERSSMYDFVAKIKKPNLQEMEVNVAVSDWTLQTLTYELIGPFNLIVEDTQMDAISGEWTILGYKTNFSNATFISPKVTLDGTEYELYTIEEITKGKTDKKGNPYAFKDGWDNHLRLQLNEMIPYKILKAAAASNKLEEYKYFHIKVGNLYKKIEIANLDVEPVLTVTPQKIILDVRELMGSHTNSGSYVITYDTNIDVENENDVTFKLSGATVLYNGEPSTASSTGKALKLILNNKISGTSDDFTIGDSHNSISLDFSGILSGNSYWESKHTYKLTFTLTYDDNEDPLTEEVEIEVVPYTTDYIIHFKCDKEIWENAHIYVYQCLEMPQGITSTITNQTDNGTNDGTINPSGKTVGYKSGNKDTDYNAGLEYAFSNNISFKGWKGYGGSVEYEKDGTVFRKGFVHIGGHDTNESKKFKPTGNNANHYNYDVDLNSQHFATWSESLKGVKWFCNECSNEYDLNGSDNDRGWPGAAMEYEGNGWWKYTLSGLATPGKAMIMFTNDHKDDKGLINRYPKDNAVGVPLFDFPDHEGWFLFDGEVNSAKDNHQNTAQNFYDNGSISDGTEQKMPTYITYRFYWPRNIPQEGSNTSQYAYLAWPGGKEDWNAIGKSHDNNWWVYEFKVKENETNKTFTYKLNWEFHINSNKEGSLDSFMPSTGTERSAYVNWNSPTTLIGGTPSANNIGTSYPSGRYLYYCDETKSFDNPKVWIERDGIISYENEFQNLTWHSDNWEGDPRNGKSTDGKWWKIKIPAILNGGRFVITNGSYYSDRPDYGYKGLTDSDGYLNPNGNTVCGMYESGKWTWWRSDN